MFGAAIGGWRYAGIAVAFVLASVWALVAETFLRNLYQPINWAIEYLAPLYFLQAALLLCFGMRLAFCHSNRRMVVAGLLAGLALIYPVVGWLADRPLVQSEVAGLAPDPTAVMTLGLLALARPGWARWSLAVVPVLWLVLSSATLLTMGADSGFVPLAAVGLAVSSWAFERLQNAKNTA